MEKGHSVTCCEVAGTHSPRPSCPGIQEVLGCKEALPVWLPQTRPPPEGEPKSSTLS